MLVSFKGIITRWFSIAMADLFVEKENDVKSLGQYKTMFLGDVLNSWWHSMQTGRLFWLYFNDSVPNGVFTLDISKCEKYNSAGICNTFLLVHTIRLNKKWMIMAWWFTNGAGNDVNNELNDFGFI